jgi:hypothetical protein
MNITPIIGPAIGGIIAGTVGLTVAWWKRWRDGRDQLLSVVAEVEADLDDRIVAIKDVHTASLPRLRTAIFSVRPFVDDCRFERIMELWQTYKNTDKEQLDWALSYSRHAVHEVLSPDTPNPHKRADDWMRARLKEFRNEVG